MFLTAENIETVLADESWLQSAWMLANIYLGSAAVEGLGDPIDGFGCTPVVRDAADGDSAASRSDD